MFIASTNVLALKYDFWYYIIAIKSVHAIVSVNFEVLIDYMQGWPYTQKSWSPTWRPTLRFLVAKNKTKSPEKDRQKKVNYKVYITQKQQDTPTV